VRGSVAVSAAQGWLVMGMNAQSVGQRGRER
jgi:hypothetical protein